MAAPATAIRLVLTCAVGLGMAAMAAVCFADPQSSREALSGLFASRPSQPVIGRYQMDAGGTFVLDRSTPRPLLKFEDDPEIWVLVSAKGPHGDVIYRNDTGEEMLRATNLGGMTVFTAKRPEGSAAALDGASPPLRVASLTPAALFTRFYQSSVRASRALQHQVGFETREDAEPATAAYLADAALVTCEALIDMAARPQNRALLLRISDVMIAQGGHPNVALQKGVLLVTIVPAQGLSGRPSSHRIEKAAGAH